MKKRCLPLCFLLLFLMALPAAAREPQRKIRVGFPLQQGMAELDANGHYSGYTYEFLQEIAQYTGWEYEFVTAPETAGDPAQALAELLEQGHLDLLGPIPATTANLERFSFPGYSYGTVSSALYVPGGSGLNETNYRDVDGMRIAVYGQSFHQDSGLENFFASNGIHASLIACASETEQIEAVQSGRADALLGNDMAIFDGMRVIARFSPAPFYFAAARGNTSIISSLNLAIQKITASDPYFTARLHEKYFSFTGDGFSFSEEELAFLEKAPPIRVLVIPNHAPFQHFDDSGEFLGVTRNVLDAVSEKTGLEFVYTKGSAPFDAQLRDADLMAAIPYSYELAERYNVALTRPFSEAQTVMISNRSADISRLDDRRLVLPQGFSVEGHDSADVTRLPNVRECIAAVNRGEADFSFANGYTASYYNNQAIYKNITLTPQTGTDQRVCFGVVKPADSDLLSILNKCILSMAGDGTIETMLYTNTAPSGEWFSLSFLAANYPLEIAVTVLAVLAAVLGAIGWMLRVRFVANRELALAGRRYLLLSEVSNEYLFEYDYSADRIRLSPKMASLFGCGQEIEGWRAAAESSGNVLAYDPAGILTRKSKKEKLERDLLLTLAQGVRCWFRIFCMTLSDQSGQPAYLTGKLTNIQKEMEEKGLLLEKSQKDGLTGVYNAATSRELITSYLDSQTGREAAALLMIDIDSFKSVNDLMGHYVGDEVLQYVAGRLRSLVRKSDIVGRLGGDEFIVLMKNASDREAVLRKGDELCNAIRKTIQGHGGELLITVSIGGVMADGSGFDELYRKADQALYTVKRLGKDRFFLSSVNEKPKQPQPAESAHE